MSAPMRRAGRSLWEGFAVFASGVVLGFWLGLGAALALLLRAAP